MISEMGEVKSSIKYKLHVLQQWKGGEEVEVVSIEISDLLGFCNKGWEVNF